MAVCVVSFPFSHSTYNNLAILGMSKAGSEDSFKLEQFTLRKKSPPSSTLTDLHSLASPFNSANSNENCNDLLTT